MTPTVLNRRLKGRVCVPDAPQHLPLPGFPAHSLFSVWLSGDSLSPTPSHSLFWHLDFLKPRSYCETHWLLLLHDSQSLPLSFLPIPQYFLSTRWLTIFQRQIFSLASSRAACRFKNRWQSPNTHTRTHALYPRLLTHCQVCIQCAYRYTYLTLRGVYVLDNTAKPTIKKNLYTHMHEQTHTDTHT